MTTQDTLTSFSSSCIARENCQRSGNTEWLERHGERLLQLMDSVCGAGLHVTLNLDMTTMSGSDDDPEVLVFDVLHAMMTEHGMHDGSFQMTILVRPGFIAPNITVECDEEGFADRWPDRDLDREQDYVVEMLLERLRQPAPPHPVIT
tara:strand:+ start:1464 stop:1907 length:444 start_codon:yes stop_codon:yes gene_type:complete